MVLGQIAGQTGSRCQRRGTGLAGRVAGHSGQHVDRRHVQRIRQTDAGPVIQSSIVGSDAPRAEIVVGTGGAVPRTYDLLTDVHADVPVIGVAGTTAPGQRAEGRGLASETGDVGAAGTGGAGVVAGLADSAQLVVVQGTCLETVPEIGGSAASHAGSGDRV